MKASDMHCSVCGKYPPRDPVTLWRVNPKGVPGIWHCNHCLTPSERRKLDPELVHLDDIISGRQIPVI